MHRSGTSLCSRWLHNAGVDMGETLLSGTESNPFGHYEDLDFLHFHERLLRSNGQNYLVTSLDDIPVIDPKFRKEAKRVVAQKNEKNSQWGFKDPRTCLFAEFWDSVCESATYLVIFRKYGEVVQSLANREIGIAVRDSGFIRKLFYRIFGLKSLTNYVLNRQQDYLSAWIVYNQKILDFVARKPKEHCCIIDYQDFLEQYQRVEQWLFNRGFDITPGLYPAISSSPPGSKRFVDFDEAYCRSEHLLLAKKIQAQMRSLAAA